MTNKGSSTTYKIRKIKDYFKYRSNDTKKITFYFEKTKNYNFFSYVVSFLNIHNNMKTHFKNWFYIYKSFVLRHKK